METLKPCPFCGGSVSARGMIGTWYENGEETEYDSFQWAILHNKWFTTRCPADTFTDHENFRTLECPEADAQKQRLIKAWNTRKWKTCRLELEEPNEDGVWWCSYCESYHQHKSKYPWEYCPRCGAKAVD